MILIGEMRDLETIEAALTTAETGHLTFATLHTNSCVETINRIVDVFPPHQQLQVRTQLSFVLEGVIVPAADPSNRRRPRAGHGSDDSEPGHPEPDPGRQGFNRSTPRCSSGRPGSGCRP